MKVDCTFYLFYVFVLFFTVLFKKQVLVYHDISKVIMSIPVSLEEITPIFFLTGCRIARGEKQPVGRESGINGKT